MMGLLFMIVYFLVAYLVARFYEERGQSPLLGFLLSVLLSPLIAMVIGLFLGIDYSRLYQHRPMPPSPEDMEPEDVQMVIPRETPEERKRRAKKEIIIVSAIICGLLLITAGVFIFISKQVEDVKKTDRYYKEMTKDE